MSYIIKTIFYLTLALSIAAPSFAATYYVSTDGNDSGPGSMERPWAHCPGLAGWSGSAVLMAGDKVYFDRSDTWKMNSGSQGLWVAGGVEYIGDEWGSGTQRAKFDGVKNYGQDRAIISIFEDDKSLETTVKGFEVNGNRTASRGIMIKGNSSLTGAIKRVENCEVHGTGDPVNRPTQYMYGIIVVPAGPNCTIRNVQLLNNIVYDTDHSVIALYAGYNTANVHIYDVLIRGNTIYGGYVDPTTGGPGLLLKNHVENIIVEENHFYNNGSNIIIQRVNAPAGTSAPTNITIRKNIFRGGEKGKGRGIYTHGSTPASVEIYGNLFFQNPLGGIKFESNLSGSASYKIYNNTFYNNGTGSQVDVAGGTFSTLEIKNNILYPGSINDRGGRVTSQSNNLTTNLQFKNPSNLPTGFTGTHGVNLAPNKDGLSIISGPALDGGAVLGARYNTSINSITRPTSGKWEIGAYQSGSNLTISPPSGLRILAVN